MRNDIKIAHAVKIISLGLPVVIALLVFVSNTSFDKFPNDLIKAYGNGSLLIPFGIIVLGVMIRRFTELNIYILATLGLITILAFIAHGLLLQRTIAEESINLWIVLSFVAAYVVASIVYAMCPPMVAMGTEN